MVAGSSVGTSLPSDTLGREFDPGKRDFSHLKLKTKIKMPNGWRTINFVSTQNSTWRSTRERNGWILLAIEIKARTAEGRWMKNPVWPRLVRPTNLMSRMCFCVFSSHPFWTSSSLDVPAGVTQEKGHTGFFHPPSFCGACLDFCREKDSAIPFPRRPWSRILCTNELIVLHPLGIFILVNPICRDRTHVPTCQKVTRYLLSYRGDRQL